MPAQTANPGDSRSSRIDSRKLAMWFQLGMLRYATAFFSSGREISKSGTTSLSWGMESITGYNIIEAEDLDAAEKIAQDNPYIASIRVYEIGSM